MMKKLGLGIIVLIVMLAFWFCSNSSDNSTENQVFQINIENCKVSIDLKLSDLIDSCWLVSLETTKESVLSDYLAYLFISHDYILIVDRNGVYKYSAEGKFIKKIINFGRGPQELSLAPMFYYYETKSLLFIDDYFGHKDYILCYDVKTETFLPSIKKCFPDRWGSFIIYNDSLIMGSLTGYGSETNPYAIFLQNFKGNFISGIQSKRKCISTQNPSEAFQRMLIYTGDQQIHVKYIYDDTLFSLKNNQLSPYFITRYNSARIELPYMLPNIGDKRTYFERFENSSFIIFRNLTYKGLIPFKSGAYKADYKTLYFFLNKSNSRYGEIKSYTDDFIGKIQSNEDETMVFPTSLPNDKLYVLYYPHDLLQKTSIDLVRQGFPESAYSQLNKIKSNLTVTDNPILLIGKPKKRLLIPK